LETSFDDVWDTGVKNTAPGASIYPSIPYSAAHRARALRLMMQRNITGPCEYPATLVCAPIVFFYELAEDHTQDISPKRRNNN
jgi:hypothetical protein